MASSTRMSVRLLPERVVSPSEGCAVQSKMPQTGALHGLPSPSLASPTATLPSTRSCQSLAHANLRPLSALVMVPPLTANNLLAPSLGLPLEGRLWLRECPLPLGLLPWRRLWMPQFHLTLHLVPLHRENLDGPSYRRMNLVSLLTIMTLC